MMTSSQEHQNYCVKCCDPSTFRCERCGDPYCSENCQILDFPSHRHICFPIPKLIPVNIEELAINALEIEPVIIEKKSETKSIPKEEKRDEKLQGNVTGPLKMEDTVVGFNTELEIMMNIIDAEKDLSYVLSEMKINSLGNKINFDEKTEKQTNDKIENKSRELVLNQPDKKVLMINDLKIHEWPKAKNIKVRLLDIIKEQSKTVISFVEDKQVISSFYDFMEREVEKCHRLITEKFNFNYLPKKNEIVLGNNNGIFRRACVLDPAENGVVVLFIDYGNMDLLTTSEILPIPAETFLSKLSFEICSRQFIVDNIPEILDEKQEEILESKKMMITNISIDESGISHCEIFGF